MLQLDVSFIAHLYLSSTISCLVYPVWWTCTSLLIYCDIKNDYSLFLEKHKKVLEKYIKMYLFFY